MSRSADVVAELIVLQSELQDLHQTEETVPCGAHIHALVELAIERLEAQIVALQRARTVVNNQFSSDSLATP